MFELIETLAGEALAAELSGINLTRFQIFKKERKVHLGLESETFVHHTLLDKLTKRIKDHFQLKDVILDFTYTKPILTEETVAAVYENIHNEILKKLPAARGILLNSHAVLEEGQFVICLQFGGEQTLIDNGVLQLVEKQLAKVYLSPVQAIFKNEKVSPEKVFEKLESEHAKLVREAGEAAAAAEAAKP